MPRHKLADFARGNDIAAVTSAVAVPIQLQQVQSEVGDQVSQNGATLESLHIIPQTGRFHVEGSASNWEGSAAFSFSVIPGLYGSTPGAGWPMLNVKVNPRSWPALVFTTADVQTNADPALWLAIGSSILGLANPMFPIIVFGMADSVAESLHATIASYTDVIQPRVQHLKSDTPGIPVIRIEALGAQLTDFLNDNIKLTIRGALTPGAYVRWFHDVKNNQVAYDSKNNAWNYAGQVVVKRHSNLHRTDKPCANAFKRSRYTYLTQTLDKLPFPLANLELHRTQLCDYCFYGGPAGIRPSL